MKTIETIIAELESFAFDKNGSARLASIAEEIDCHPESASLIEPVLRLFERFPQEDFGAPGPLVHAIEKHYKHGYELQLAASLERAPTSLTLWLANRIVNAKDANAPRFREIISRISQSSALPDELRAEARHYSSIS